MLGEKFGHFCLNRLRQQGTRSVAQHLGERVSKRPWLKQLDHGSIGHGVSLLCWRSGGSNTPTIRRLLPVRPSPTSANSSEHDFGNFSLAGRKFFFKIDYFDVSMEFGSEDPADPAKTTRVLTIMLAEEY